MGAGRGLRRQAAVAALVAVLAAGASASSAGAQPDGTIIFQPVDASGGSITLSSSGGVALGESIEVDLVADSPPLPKAIRIDVPPGYTLDLNAKLGDEIGDASISIVSPNGGSFASGFGPLVAAAPPAEPCVPGSHEAVWRVSTTLAAQQITVNVLADRASDGRSYVINVCPTTLASDAVASASITLSIYGLAAPTAPGDYRWRSVVIPRTGKPYELQAVVPLPESIDVRARYDGKRKRAIVSGKVNEGGRPVAGAFVVITGRRNDRSSGIVETRTNADGRFSQAMRVAGTTDFQVFAAGTMEPCSPVSDPSLECLGATVVPPDDGAATLWVSRPTGAKRALRAADQRRAEAIGLRASDFPADFQSDFAGAEECLNPKRERNLTITGESTSPAFFHSDLGEPPSFVLANGVTRIYASAEQARAAFTHQARTSTVRCVLNHIELDAPIVPLRLRGGRASVRAFRATASDADLTLNYDVIFLRRGRSVTILQIALINAPADLEPGVVASIANRMR